MVVTCHVEVHIMAMLSIGAVFFGFPVVCVVGGRVVFTLLSRWRFCTQLDHRWVARGNCEANLNVYDFV